MGYHKNKWAISLQFTHSKHEIDPSEPDNDSSNNVIYRAQNLKYLNQIALANAWAFSITNWWEVQTNVVAQYLFLQTAHLPVNVQRRNYELNLNVTNSLRLPKDFAVEVSGMYQSRTSRGVIESLPVSSLNLGIQKKVGKGAIRFAVDDIFNQNNWKLKMTLPQDKNLNTYFHYDFHSRFARITYTRGFGNSKLKSIKLKSASEEERGRVSN
jgi:outer membrane beta-barrel protein